MDGLEIFSITSSGKVLRVSGLRSSIYSTIQSARGLLGWLFQAFLCKLLYLLMFWLLRATATRVAYLVDVHTERARMESEKPVAPPGQGMKGDNLCNVMKTSSTGMYTVQRNSSRLRRVTLAFNRSSVRTIASFMSATAYNQEHTNGIPSCHPT